MNSYVPSRHSAVKSVSESFLYLRINTPFFASQILTSCPAAVMKVLEVGLYSALRVLRGLAKVLEDISELRLAVPRAAMLRQVGCRGCRSFGPLNSGWPDHGCEVSCTLFLGDAAAEAQ